MPIFAMRQMNLAQDNASISMQRLSSGLRINSATDDAAGLAIATGMTSKIQGYNQSIRNANDGISVLQTAEGTLGEVTNVLQRVRELTVQAGNDTNSQLNRKAISKEIKMLSSSIKDMMQGTEFNGLPLFSNRQNAFNIGLEGGDIGLDIGGFNYQQLALDNNQGATGLHGGRTNADNSRDQSININGLNLTAISGTTPDKVIQLNKQLNTIGISAQGANQVISSSGTGITDGNLTINGAQVSPSNSINQLADNINRDVGGINATVDTNGQLLLSNNSGQDIIIDNQGNEAGSGLLSDTFKGVISLQNRDQKDISISLNDNGVQSDLDALGLTERRGNDSLQSQRVSGTNADQITINSYSLEINAPISSAFDIASAFNDVSKQSGVKVNATTEALLSAPDFTHLPSSADDLRINGQTIDFTTTKTVDDVLTAINGQLQNSDIVASTNSDGQLSLSSKLGVDIIIEQGSSDFLQTGLGTSKFHGTLNFQSQEGALKIASNLAGQENKESALAKIGASDTEALMTRVSGINVSSSQAVGDSLETIDQALLKITNERSSYGAQQNRLEQTINQFSGMVINSEASRSRIMDTDFAAESATLAKNQLLMQTSSAMLVRFSKMHGQQILSLINSLK
jgi:flagellin